MKGGLKGCSSHRGRGQVGAREDRSQEPSGLPSGLQPRREAVLKPQALRTQLQLQRAQQEPRCKNPGLPSVSLCPP